MRTKWGGEGKKTSVKTTGHPTNIQTGHLSNGEVQTVQLTLGILTRTATERSK